MDQIMNLLKQIPEDQIEKFVKEAVGVASKSDANGLASKFDLGDLNAEHIESLINFTGEGEKGMDIGNIIGGLLGKK